MNISKEEIEAVKRSNDLAAVIESYGTKLKKKGSNYVGLCPFHEEKTPSFTVNPKTSLYHCFGCNAGGDVIGFVTKKEGVGFREAMERLRIQKTEVRSQKKGKTIKATADQPPSPLTAVPSASPVPSVNHTKLLNRVVSFYHKSFCEDNRGMEYLKGRGITDNSLFSDFQIGFSNGTLLNTIPEEGDVIEALKEIGILNDKGNEMFYNCVVFPIFDENKDCVGLYGRRIKDGETAHLYLPGPWRGVFNFQAAKRSKSIILTESIIDALTLYNAGFRDVIPCYGVHGYTRIHIELFKQNQTKEAYICFDRDEAGKEGAEKLSMVLKEKGLDVFNMQLPVGEGLAPSRTDDKVDLNSFFFLTADAASIFERLLKEANPRNSTRSDKIVKHEQRLYEKTDTGFVVQYEARRYDVRGVVKDNIKLKATIKAVKQSSVGSQQSLDSARTPHSAFHLDTVDLYSNRSRLFFAKACSVLFSEKEEVITEDITRLIDLCEAYKPDDKEKTSFQKMTRTEEEEALDFLKDASLFNRLLSDFETIGLTGEDANKLMGYLAATSRKLDEPLSVLIQSRSAAGKINAPGCRPFLNSCRGLYKIYQANRPGPFLQRRRLSCPQAFSY